VSHFFNAATDFCCLTIINANAYQFTFQAKVGESAKASEIWVQSAHSETRWWWIFDKPQKCQI